MCLTGRERERLQSGLQVHEVKQSCGRRQGREAVCVCSCVCVCVCWGRGLHHLSIQWLCLNSTTFLHCTRKMIVSLSSVQFSSVVSNSLQPHGHARLPWPSPIPGVYSDSCPLSWWCHSTILSSVVPFSSRIQSLQHQSLFKWVSSLHQVAKVLEFQLQHQSFQWIFRTDFL